MIEFNKRPPVHEIIKRIKIEIQKHGSAYVSTEIIGPWEVKGIETFGHVYSAYDICKGRYVFKKTPVTKRYLLERMFVVEKMCYGPDYCWKVANSFNSYDEAHNFYQENRHSISKYRIINNKTGSIDFEFGGGD